MSCFIIFSVWLTFVITAVLLVYIVVVLCFILEQRTMGYSELLFYLLNYFCPFLLYVRYGSGGFRFFWDTK